MSRKFLGESWAPEDQVMGSVNRRAVFDEAFLKSIGKTIEQVDYEDAGLQLSSHPNPKPHWVTKFYLREP